MEVDCLTKGSFVLSVLLDLWLHLLGSSTALYNLVYQQAAPPHIRTSPFNRCYTQVPPIESQPANLMRHTTSTHCSDQLRLQIQIRICRSSLLLPFPLRCPGCTPRKKSQTLVLSGLDGPYCRGIILDPCRICTSSTKKGGYVVKNVKIVPGL